MLWFTAFFKDRGTHLERFFRVDSYSRTGTVVEIGTDASPWGMGGWLTIGGVLKHYYACPVTKEDVARYKMPIGDSNGQQLWECLAILIAVDVWAHIWSQQRIVLKIRGDNVGALVLCIKMRPANATIAIVARELALRLAELSFPPDAVHTPGVAHVLADRLSRVFAPEGSQVANNSIHPALANAEQTAVPTRDASWYRAAEDTGPASGEGVR